MEITPATIRFPQASGEWLDFVTRRPEARMRTVGETDAALRAGDDLPPIERLRLWNDAEGALRAAAAEASLLSECHPDREVRAAAEEQAQRIETVAAGRLLDVSLWAVFADVDASALDPGAQRLLSQIRRDFRRGGVDLAPEAREKLRELTERDTALSIEFARNIRDGRREIRVPAAGLAGLPDDFIEAHPADADGRVTLTTDYTDLMPVREYSTDRQTRHALVGAYGDLAWPENEAVLEQLLAVRAEKAALLGYGDWADYETETRMIGSSGAVADFLAELDEASAAAAAEEYEIVRARLQRDDPDAREVSLADFWYLMATLRREEYGVDAQEVRRYFAFEKVLAGVLDVTGRLLDVRYEPSSVGTWHPDVRSYDVVRDDEWLGRIHLDLHPREGKYNHAACFELAPGRPGLSVPEGVLLCNFSGGLLEHDEVVTFFHEFGHLVHGILGAPHPWVRFSGIETEWDFVEAPSQLLEEWAWDADVLATFATDAEGTPIPRELVARMKVADAFGRALEVRRQLGHATASYRLHVDRPGDLASATQRYYAMTSPVQPQPGAHTYAGFGHLTGYGACYYTYQWSLVIARDMLSAFGGDLMDPIVATRYRTEVLERGGSRDAAELVASFLGRPYSVDAYRAWLAGR